MRRAWQLKHPAVNFEYIFKFLMKVLLDIKDDKAPFVLELLKNFSFVKTNKLTPAKSKVLLDLQEAIDELNLIKAGKLKARKAEDLFDEL